jgi:hypothetical protein
LLLQSRRLLEAVRRQSAAISQLEGQFPGLTRVVRDRSGAVVIDEVPTDLDALLKEVQAELPGPEAGGSRPGRRHSPLGRPPAAS